MLYHASSERLKPLVTESLSLTSLNREGTLDMVHAFGSLTSILLVAFSKSSIYEALSCVPPACPAIRWANSPVKDIWEGCVQCRKGSLLSILVSHWLSCFQLMFRPHSMFRNGSCPMVTFEVSVCSVRYWNVPPSCRSFENSYSQFMPSMVFRCMP